MCDCIAGVLGKYYNRRNMQVHLQVQIQPKETESHTSLLNLSQFVDRMKPEESALGNALLSLTLWLSDVYAAGVEAFRLNGELNPGT